jgi:hypothetical protein
MASPSRRLCARWPAVSAHRAPAAYTQRLNLPIEGKAAHPQCRKL